MIEMGRSDRRRDRKGNNIVTPMQHVDTIDTIL